MYPLDAPLCVHLDERDELGLGATLLTLDPCGCLSTDGLHLYHRGGGTPCGCGRAMVAFNPARELGREWFMSILLHQHTTQIYKPAFLLGVEQLLLQSSAVWPALSSFLSPRAPPCAAKVIWDQQHRTFGTQGGNVVTPQWRPLSPSLFGRLHEFGFCWPVWHCGRWSQSVSRGRGDGIARLMSTSRTWLLSQR